jgi:glycine/D-amino acid oxidase-like deaminating enzyme
MTEQTYYAATARDTAPYPALNTDIAADVVVIGGGFTGVNTALELAERGYSVVLLEAERIGWGATGRNGGQVTGSLSGDATLEKHLAKTMGAEAADFVWSLRWRGHDIIRDRVARYAIECDLCHGHLHTAWKPSHMAELRAFAAEAEKRGMGEDVALLARGAVHARLDTALYHGGLLNRRNMHLHPLDLCRAEARAAQSLGVRLFEQTSVTDIHHGEHPVVETAAGRVTADTVILAGGAYHRLEQGRLGGKLFPAALGNMATIPLTDAEARALNPDNLAVYDTRFVLDYYRLTADNRLLFGGGANYSGKASRDIVAELRPAMERTFPRLAGIDVEYAWSGQAGIVPNRVPMVGRVSPNVFYAQGYSGHGIATSHIVAGIVAEAVAGTMARFDLFASVPHARNPFGERAGQAMLALGMWYYRMREALG